MKLPDLVVVTTSKNKLSEINEILRTSHKVSTINIPEIQSLDLNEVITHKAKEAYNKIKKPVLVEDISFEIKALKGNFFDYKSKYSDNGAQEIVPARISSELTKKVQDIAVKVYKAVGCRGVSRVDFILKDNRLPVVLEINTSPGLTPTS